MVSKKRLQDVADRAETPVRIRQIEVNETPAGAVPTGSDAGEVFVQRDDDPAEPLCQGGDLFVRKAFKLLVVLREHVEAECHGNVASKLGREVGVKQERWHAALPYQARTSVRSASALAKASAASMSSSVKAG